MTAAANGWTHVQLGDVVSQIKDEVDPNTSGLTRYVAGEHMDTDELTVSRWGEIGDGYLGPAFRRMFRAGQVLYGSRRTYLRKVARPDFDGVCANTTLVLESADPDRLIPDLLPFVMQTERFNQFSIGRSRGSVNPYVNWSDLTAFQLDLPPLSEQHRIARLLWAVEDALKCLRGLEEACARASEVVIEELFHAKSGRRQLVPMAEVLEQVQYGVSVRADSEPGKDSVPILRIPNVLRGSLDLSELKWVTLPKPDQETFALATGDVLLVRTNGNPDYVGRSLVVGDIPDRCVFASYLIRLRINQSRAIPEFIGAVINSPSMRRQLRAETKSTAGNYNLNAPSIRRQKIPLPPIDEQLQLVERVTSATQSVAACQIREEATRRLKRRLIESVFEGAI